MTRWLDQRHIDGALGALWVTLGALVALLLVASTLVGLSLILVGIAEWVA